jgi:hypothetical protein
MRMVSLGWGVLNYLIVVLDVLTEIGDAHGFFGLGWSK